MVALCAMLNTAERLRMANSNLNKATKLDKKNAVAARVAKSSNKLVAKTTKLSNVANIAVKTDDVKYRRRSRVKKRRLVNLQKRRSFLTWRRVMRYGLRNLSRNAWLTIAATIVMTITLLIIFATAAASSVLKETIASQRNKMDLSIYLKSDLPDDTLRNLAGKLRIQPNVKDVTTSTSEQEYKKSVEENRSNESYIEGLSLVAENGVNMKLPAVIHVKLHDFNKKDKIKHFIYNDSQFKKWLDEARSTSEDIETRQNTINRLSDIMNYASKLGISAAVIFIIISILTIFNTIRMTIFSRREEIDMMKSIGADNYFIRGPFLVEAETYGIISAIIAMVLGYIILTRFLPGLGGYVEVDQTRMIIEHWWWAILILLLAVGFAIGAISARLALRRYLKNR